MRESDDQSAQTNPYVPSNEVQALWPDVSGNDVNGLGETTTGRPRPVFWRTDGHSIAHSAVLRHFYGQDADNPLIREARERREKTKDVPSHDVAPEQPAHSPEKWSELAKQAGLECGADLVGICAYDPQWTYTDREDPLGKWAIVLGFAHDYENLKLAPHIHTYVEYVDQYARAGRAAKLLVNWIRDRGWPAEAKTGPLSDDVIMIPAAIEAGLGVLGKHGSMINPVFGANFRLSMVTTDMPLVSDKPVNFGADLFCQTCKICSKACPPQAIYDEKQVVRGQTKWYVNFDKCLPYFVDNRTCGMCIAQCPWSRPGLAEKMVTKMAKRMASQAK